MVEKNKHDADKNVLDGFKVPDFLLSDVVGGSSIDSDLLKNIPKQVSCSECNWGGVTLDNVCPICGATLVE